MRSPLALLRRPAPLRTPLPPTPFRSATLVVLCAVLVGAASASGCGATPDEPVRDSREALGTIVTITAYGDKDAMTRVIDDAFGSIDEVETSLSSYPDLAADSAEAGRPLPGYETETVAQFNRAPFEWHKLPSGAPEVLERIDGLGVSEEFSPGMLRVVGLYDFEGEHNVPDAQQLARLVRAARAFETSAGYTIARFEPVGEVVAPPAEPTSSYAPPAVGLDLSGAIKGLALDRALETLEKGRRKGDFTGVLLSAGSTTLVTGSKSRDAGTQPWQIGIEDPRNPDQVIGIVEYAADASSTVVGTVSTSGDYQQAFLRDGVRYHHILDPSTGTPARGIRSLTVVGASSGLDSDILSTALFVMGVDRAEAYAREHGLGLFIVDEKGRTRIVPGPEGAPFSISTSKK